MPNRHLLICALAVVSSVIAAAQRTTPSHMGQEQITEPAFDLEGVVELVDRPAAATPVEAVSFSLHPLEAGFDIRAQPDQDGRFVLKRIRPGRYLLTLSLVITRNAL